MPTSFQQFIGGAGDVLYPGIDLEPLSTAFDLYSSNPDPNLYSVIQQGLGLAQQLVSARRQIPTEGPIVPVFPGGSVQSALAAQYGVNVASTCWSENTGLTPTQARRQLMRRKVKVIRDPSSPNGIRIVQYCSKPRMNPLNAKALGRAARRLGSFQRIAAHVEKVITKACKPKRRSSRAPRMGYSCGPKRGC